MSAEPEPMTTNEPKRTALNRSGVFLSFLHGNTDQDLPATPHREVSTTDTRDKKPKQTTIKPP